MEEEKNKKSEVQDKEQEETSQSTFQTLYRLIILDWKWFVLSLVICLGLAAIYLRYTTPVYEASGKLFIKDDDNQKNNNNNLMKSSTLGIMSNSNGLENEMEIIKSHNIAAETVHDLKLYVTYKSHGRIKDVLVYKTQPVNVDIDEGHLYTLPTPINLEIMRNSTGYHVTGTYMVAERNGVQARGPFSINKTFRNLPFIINTNGGILSFTQNFVGLDMAVGASELVTINTPMDIANKYVSNLSTTIGVEAEQIATLTVKDEIPQRAIDYIRELAVCYNRQANEDKNEVALRTEAFINSRVEKINSELGSTEGALESYKRNSGVVDLEMNAGQAVDNANTYEQKLAEANTQVQLINSISSSMNDPANKYQTLPSNVGLTDQSTTSLIERYNDIVLRRNRLLRSASETSPTVTPLTAQLDDLDGSIRRAMNQVRRSMSIQRSGVASQYGKYSGQISESPVQERILKQIGRQQEVKAQLYLMLLQKREENSISLAATADKGKLIDEPSFSGKISPNEFNIFLAAFAIGLFIPALFIFLTEFFRYKIEGHDDVARLTKLPIIADIPIASETAKTKADIVVHENKNGYMEEIFRSLRTNLQFMLKEGEKTIMLTSSISGEGKTFTTANLAVSIALLGKKVVLVGLDIRKPRLAELFEISDHRSGITNLLTHENPTVEEVKQQILQSGVNNNLDLLMAGPIPPNPSELIARPSLGKVFEILKKEYDYIIIDTAPVGLVTDTLQVGTYADVSVFVCRADYTPKESFGLVNGLQAENKLKNLCVAINGVDLSKKKYGYYYGYGRYGRYGKYGRSHGYGYYGGHYGGNYGYGNYGHYGSYSNNKYVDKNDDTIKH